MSDIQWRRWVDRSLISQEITASFFPPTSPESYYSWDWYKWSQFSLSRGCNWGPFRLGRIAAVCWLFYSWGCMQSPAFLGDTGARVFLTTSSTQGPPRLRRCWRAFWRLTIGLWVGTFGNAVSCVFLLSVLIADHSFVKRFHSDVPCKFDPRAAHVFNLTRTATMSFNGVGGLTVLWLVRKLRLLFSHQPPPRVIILEISIYARPHKLHCFLTYRAWIKVVCLSVCLWSQFSLSRGCNWWPFRLGRVAAVFWLFYSCRCMQSPFSATPEHGFSSRRAQHKDHHV